MQLQFWWAIFPKVLKIKCSLWVCFHKVWHLCCCLSWGIHLSDSFQLRQHWYLFRFSGCCHTPKDCSSKDVSLNDSLLLHPPWLSACSSLVSYMLILCCMCFFLFHTCNEFRDSQWGALTSVCTQVTVWHPGVTVAWEGGLRCSPDWVLIVCLS